MSFTEAQRAFSKSGRTSSSQLDKDDDEAFDKSGRDEHDVTPVYEVAGRKSYGSRRAFFKSVHSSLVSMSLMITMLAREERKKSMGRLLRLMVPTPAITEVKRHFSKRGK